MSIEIASRQGGIFNPEEISVLRQVFDEACHVLCATTDSEQASDIALTILSIYKKGTKDRDALLAAILSPPTKGALDRRGSSAKAREALGAHPSDAFPDA